MISEASDPEKICRFCGQEKPLGKFIFSFEAAKIGLLSKIKRFFPDEVELVSVETSLPKFICDSCELIINNFETFRNLVKEVQQTLHKKFASEKLTTDFDKAPLDKLTHVCLAMQKEDVLVISCKAGSLSCSFCNLRLRYSQIPKTGSCLGVCSHCGFKDEICKFVRRSTKLQCPKCWKPRIPIGNNSVERKFECEICKKTYGTKSHLNRHQVTHFGNKSFNCDDCGLSFWQKSTLQTHSLIHKKLNPFPCKWCGQAFRHKLTLASHVMSIHGVTSNSKNLYECDKCNKKFVHKEKLHRHYRSHSGEKPFKCDVCQRCFSQRINLQTHLKKHENVPRYQSTSQEPNSESTQGDLIQELLSFESMSEADSLPTFPMVDDQFRKEEEQLKSANTDNMYFNTSSSSYLIYSSSSILYDLDDPPDVSGLPSFSRLNPSEKSELDL